MSIPEPPSSEITPEPLFLRRREFIANGARILGTAAAVGAGLTWLLHQAPAPDPPKTAPIEGATTLPVTQSEYTVD